MLRSQGVIMLTDRYILIDSESLNPKCDVLLQWWENSSQKCCLVQDNPLLFRCKLKVWHFWTCNLYKWCQYVKVFAEIRRNFWKCPCGQKNFLSKINNQNKYWQPQKELVLTNSLNMNLVEFNLLKYVILPHDYI